ncbi:Uncharacterized protein Fot_42395 [Forsythia ovata]|uniref:Uncharacterized protein n=1 Tax=Forsythia ovata TaxID=205694 RepID=A0ABD1RL32_9LAMI
MGRSSPSRDCLSLSPSRQRNPNPQGRVAENKSGFGFVEGEDKGKSSPTSSSLTSSATLLSLLNQNQLEGSIPATIGEVQTLKVGAHSEGQVKIYELLDPLELEKWQLQISNKIAMQTKEFGYDPKVNGILACQWNVQDLIYSFLCIDEDMKLYISKWNAG